MKRKASVRVWGHAGTKHGEGKDTRQGEEENTSGRLPSGEILLTEARFSPEGHREP